MKEITPVPPDSGSSNFTAPSDRVFGDGPDELPHAGSTLNWLHMLIFILVLGGVYTLGAWSQNHAPQPPPTGPYQSVKTSSPTSLTVHITGAVRRPGVYSLPFDARVNDAIQRAAPLPNADVNALNLAAWAEDGSRIEVPFKIKNQSQSVPLARDEPLITVAPPPGEKAVPSVAKGPHVVEKSAKNPSIKATPARKININTASLDDLTLLPGIGPAFAERIIEYRKANGTFRSVDDLDEVKGIGEKKLEKLRPYASVR